MPLYNPVYDSPSSMFSNILAPLNPQLVNGGFTTSANRGHFARVEAPKTGILTDLAVYIFTSAGNISVAVYDTNATTLTRLYTTGTIACPATSGWNIVGSGSLGVSVTKGIQYYLFVSTDSASTGFGRYPSFAASEVSRVPTGYLTSATRVAGLDNTLHPAPATYSMGSMADAASAPAVMTRIT